MKATVKKRILIFQWSNIPKHSICILCYLLKLTLYDIQSLEVIWVLIVLTLGCNVYFSAASAASQISLEVSASHHQT